MRVQQDREGVCAKSYGWEGRYVGTACAAERLGKSCSEALRDFLTTCTTLSRKSIPAKMVTANVLCVQDMIFKNMPCKIDL